MTTTVASKTPEDITQPRSLGEEFESFILPDQRTLAYAKYGANAENSKYLPIFYFHGHPSCRIECGLLHGAALKLGLYIIAIDRPGMGRSTFQENRKLTDWPKDVLALADHLSIDKFAIIGASGGGPFVLACLHEIPTTRLKAATIIAGIYSTKKFDTTGMLFKSRALMWAAAWSPSMVGKLLDLTLGKAARNEAKPEALYEMIEAELAGTQRPEVERQAFERAWKDPESKRSFVESVREGVKISSAGAAWELWLFASEWGFNWEGVDASRLTIWHGALDVNVPVSMADQAVALLKGVQYRRLESEGHFSLLFCHDEEILLDLAARLS